MAIVIKSYKELGRGPMIGDRVMITSEKFGTRWNPEGKMDRYLSNVMTVRIIRRGGNDFSLAMIEDKNDMNYSGGWCWFPEMIQGVIIDDLDEDISSWTGVSGIECLLM